MGVLKGIIFSPSSQEMGAVELQHELYRLRFATTILQPHGFIGP